MDLIHIALRLAENVPDNLTAIPVPGYDPDSIWRSLSTWGERMTDRILSWSSIWQLGVILVAAGLGWLLARVPRKRITKAVKSRQSVDYIFRLYRSVTRILWPSFTLVLLWGATFGFDAFRLPNEGLRIAASLLTAWIVVRFVASQMKPGFWPGFLTVTAWLLAALYILRWLQPLAHWLDGAAVSLGDFRISALRLISSVFIAFFALWLGRAAGDITQSHLRTTKSLTPSMAGLLGQVLKIAFMVMAVVVALNFVGVDLTALAVFSGALGVGIGFGMQAIFSNFISGVIILFEKSLKVGDFIELPTGVTGLVREINIRSTLVTTNDNVDILVPNEEFIKAQVINWTLRDSMRRIRVPFGVAYGSDKEKVRLAGLEAAEAVEWTYTADSNRAPQVWLVEFGDSSLNFELVVWLTAEAVVKPARVQADYNWALHTALQRHGLEIPFPQRDLNIRQPAELSVRLSRASATPPATPDDSA